MSASPPPGPPPGPLPGPPPGWGPLPGPPPGYPSEAAPLETPWQRLDRRMLLVHPVTELIRFLPVLVGILVVGRAGGGWQLVGVVIPVLFGLWRFFTTTFRVTPSQVELRRGLVSRKVLTARLDRVRTVELSAPLIHRLLGLAKVKIGTGSASITGDDGFDLDALRSADATRLREDLRRRTTAPADLATDAGGDDGVPAPAAAPARPDEEILRLDPRWARFAPFSSSGTVIAAGVLAVLGQLLGALDIDPTTQLGMLGRLDEIPLLPLVLGLVALLVALGAVFGVLGYLVSNWRFLLTRESSGESLRVRKGLLTTTDTSLETVRVRGVELVEPLGHRSLGAGRLQALVVGASLMSGGATTVAPTCPRATAAEVAARITGASGALDLPLRQHGPVARRRRFIRTLVPATLVVLGLTVAALYDLLPWWAPVAALLLLPLGALLARDRYRRLGHALTPTHLVSRSGSLSSSHVVLDLDGVIGWHVQESFFQRRGGVATLVATAAAGTQAFALVDVPEPLAVAIAAEADPALVEQFLA